jgi:hypothetical protein
LPIKEYKDGKSANIFVYVNQRGDSPAHSFIESLDKHNKIKIVRYINEFAYRGKIRNETKFRCEGNPIYAFKSDNARVLCFYLRSGIKRTLVLTHGYPKNKPKLPKTEWQKAYDIYLEVCNTDTN